MNVKSEGLEINLPKLLMTYVRKWWIFVIAALICGALGYGYAQHYLTPLYQASTTIYVNNIREDQEIDYVSQSNLYASQALVSTYINIVKSDRVIDKVTENLGDGYNSEMIKNMVSASQVETTEIFSINVVSADPEQAATVANAMGDVVPDVIGELIEGSSARIIDRAKVPQWRFFPSYRYYTMVGGGVGVALALIYITVMFLLDVRIKDEEDLNSLFELPILGQIPEFASANKVPSYGYGKKRRSDDGDKNGNETKNINEEQANGKRK